MRGVSEVIAIILILMITISLAGLVYMFMSTTMSDVTSSAGSTVDTTTSSMLTSFTIESMDVAKVYVRNTGQNALTSLSVYVNDEPAVYNITPSISAGTVGTITIYSFIPDGATVKVTSPNGFSTSKVAHPCDRAVGCWDFDEKVGTTVYDSSPNGNTGSIGGTVFGNFENSLDGFGLDCGGSPTSSYTEGEIGQGIRIWSTGGDGLACMFKTIGSFSAGYTVFFYAKGYVQAQFYDGGTASYIQDVESGCRTENGGTYMYTVCNGGNPYQDWKLFKLVAYRSSGGSDIAFYNNGAGGESNAGYYDFITSGPIWTDSIHGSGIRFDGVDDSVLIQPFSGISSRQWTILYLVKPNGFGYQQNHMRIDESGGYHIVP